MKRKNVVSAKLLSTDTPMNTIRQTGQVYGQRVWQTLYRELVEQKSTQLLSCLIAWPIGGEDAVRRKTAPVSSSLQDAFSREELIVFDQRIRKEFPQVLILWSSRLTGFLYFPDLAGESCSRGDLGDGSVGEKYHGNLKDSTDFERTAGQYCSWRVLHAQGFLWCGQSTASGERSLNLPTRTWQQEPCGSW